MIKHIKCDIFESGADVICHQVNCQGVMGNGIARQVRERYPNVFEVYKAMCVLSKRNGKSLLQNVQRVQINEKQVILNLFAQNKYGYNGHCYTNYDALKTCLIQINDMYKNTNKTIAFPYLMSCARGGGDWSIVYKMIEDAFKDYNGDILICEYDGK